MISRPRRARRPAIGQLAFVWVTTWLPLEVLPPSPTPRQDRPAPSRGRIVPTLAQATRQRATQAARGDDGKEGQSARPQGSKLLSMSPLASPGRELGEWPDHALLSDLRCQTGRQGQAGRNCFGRMGWSLVLTLSQQSGTNKIMKNLFNNQPGAVPGRTSESGCKKPHRSNGRKLSVDSKSTLRTQV